MTYTPRHARTEPRTPRAALTDPIVAAGVTPPVLDPADLPPEPVGEVPAFVAVPSQARQVMREAGIDLDVFDDSLAQARADERLATSLARCRAARDFVVEAARAFVDGHPLLAVVADDPETRHAKQNDLFEAVREYEEVVP